MRDELANQRIEGIHYSADWGCTVDCLKELIRMGRNPATGEIIKIAAKRVVKFRVAKAAKDAILGTK